MCSIQQALYSPSTFAGDNFYSDEDDVYLYVTVNVAVAFAAPAVTDCPV